MTMTLSAGMPGIQNKIKVQRQMPSPPVPPLGFVTERIPAYARRLKYKPSDASPASYWLRLCMCMSKGSHMSLLCGMSVGCWMTIVANHIQLNQRYQSHTHTHIHRAQSTGKFLQFFQTDDHCVALVELSMCSSTYILYTAQVRPIPSCSCSDSISLLDHPVFCFLQAYLWPVTDNRDSSAQLSSLSTHKSDL